MPSILQPDTSWTLFLDRDGVINIRKIDEYVLQPKEFLFIDGTLDAIARLTNLFGLSFVVTNQQGIGKGMMTEDDLFDIHSLMLKEINRSGGKIDKVYYCSALKESRSFMRKPMPGMGLLAKKEFPEINFKKAVMVGDAISDMQFGKNLGMITVFIGSDKKTISRQHRKIDFAFANLASFSDYLLEG